MATELDDLRKTLGEIQTPGMAGDDLASILLEPFEDMPDAEKCRDAVLDAIHHHYVQSLRCQAGVSEAVAWRCEDLILPNVSVIDDWEHAQMRMSQPHAWKVTPLYARPAPIEITEENEASDKAAVEIADAVILWMVKYELLDADLEYRDDDIIEVLNDLHAALQGETK